jgi:hypothetical protein
MQLSREINPLVVNIFLAKPHSPFTKRQIQKLLFKLKQELPENDYLQRVLPYYWYDNGPFSEIVANSITQLTRGERIRQIDADGYKLLELNRSKVQQGEVAIEREIRDALEIILAEHDTSHPQPLIDEVYWKYAPREFIPLFAIEFQRAFHQHMVTKNIEKILSLEDVLYKCEAALPLEPFFESYNELFSLFVSYTALLFDKAREGGRNVGFSRTDRVAGSLWARFAKGVRVLPDGHDGFYDNRLRGWLSGFKKETREKLRLKVNEYILHVTKCTTSQASLKPAFLDTLSI